MPVMWDSYISGWQLFFYFHHPLPPVVNQQSQLKAGKCCAPFCGKVGGRVTAGFGSCCWSIALGLDRPIPSWGIISMQRLWQELALVLHPVHAQNKSPEHRTLLHSHLWHTLVCCSPTKMPLFSVLSICKLTNLKTENIISFFWAPDEALIWDQLSLTRSVWGSQRPAGWDMQFGQLLPEWEWLSWSRAQFMPFERHLFCVNWALLGNCYVTELNSVKRLNYIDR